MAFEELIKAGTTSKIIEVMLRDSATGGGKTGVAYSAVTASYTREGGTRTAITLASGTAGDAYSSGKWAEVDATNCKGLYQIHIPNAAIASGAAAVTLSLQASGVIDKSIRIALPAGDLMAANIPAAANTVAANAMTVDGLPLAGVLKLLAAALCGKLAGVGTGTITIRAADDSKTRITTSVDGAGNRTAVTLDDS